GDRSHFLSFPRRRSSDLPLQPWLHRLRAWWLDPRRALRPLLVPDDAPLDLSLVGRMLWHAALVGVAAGLMGAAFFAALEWMQDRSEEHTSELQSRENLVC